MIMYFPLSSKLYRVYMPLGWSTFEGLLRNQEATDERAMIEYLLLICEGGGEVIEALE